MAKSSVIKKQPKKQEPDFDFSEFLHIDSFPDEEVVVGVMGGLIEAYRHQQQTAMELTRLVIEKTVSENRNEEDVFSTFKRASKLVADVSPIRELFEKINA